MHIIILCKAAEKLTDIFVLESLTYNLQIMCVFVSIGCMIFKRVRNRVKLLYGVSYYMLLFIIIYFNLINLFIVCYYLSVMCALFE